MYEYVCEHVVPGCTYTARSESREQLNEVIDAHLRERHDIDRHDDRVAEALRTTGITFIRPA